MRSSTLAVGSILMFSGILAAQTPAPGTFNNTPSQTTQQTSGSNNGGYIVSPPSIALGNGITPTVVSSQDTINITSPQNTSANAPAVQANNSVNDNSASSDTTNAAVASGTSQQGASAQAAPVKHYDFARAPGGDNGPIVGSMADTSVDLGEVARQARKGRQIAKRTITNADVMALNGQSPSGDQSQTGANGNAIGSPQQDSGAMNGVNPTPNSGGTAGAVQQQGAAPVYSQPATRGQHDPFAQPTTDVQPGKPNAQKGDGIPKRGNSARPVYANPSDDSSKDNSGSDKQQLPRSSSLLPLLGTLGALSTLAGISYFKMR